MVKLPPQVRISSSTFGAKFRSILSFEDGIPRHGHSVLHEGVEVGKVASGTFSPTLESGIATAYVPAELAAPGTRLSVEIRKKTVPATVVKPPFVSKTSLSA